MGPNGHREKDNYHSYSLWINSYGTSLNGRYFFRLESNVHSLRHEWHLGNEINFYRVRSGTWPDWKELKTSNQQYFKLKNIKRLARHNLIRAVSIQAINSDGTLFLTFLAKIVTIWEETSKKRSKYTCIQRSVMTEHPLIQDRFHKKKVLTKRYNWAKNILTNVNVTFPVKFIQFSFLYKYSAKSSTVYLRNIPITK